MKKVELKKVKNTLEEIQKYDGRDYDVEYINEDLPTEDREIRISFVEKIGNTDINKVVFMSLYTDSKIVKHEEGLTYDFCLEDAEGNVFEIYCGSKCYLRKYNGDKYFSEDYTRITKEQFDAMSIHA